MGHLPLKHINRLPSKGCAQRLSTRELIERTQEDRTRRKAKKGGMRCV